MVVVAVAADGVPKSRARALVLLKEVWESSWARYCNIVRPCAQLQRARSRDKVAVFAVGDLGACVHGLVPIALELTVRARQADPRTQNA